MKLKNRRIMFFIILIGIIPVFGYGLMHALVFILPMSETTTFSHLIYTLIVIALGLLVPYAMLKALGSAAHTQNPEEKELKLADLPKDKEQFDNSH